MKKIGNIVNGFRNLRHLNNFHKSRCLSNKSSITQNLQNGPGLKEFLTPENVPEINTTEERIPYLINEVSKIRRKVYFQLYGCQMNVNDTEIVWAILKKNNFLKTEDIEEADVILVMTCAIREGAERKIWHLLDHLRGLKKRRSIEKTPLKIGVLGCMAERLKHNLVEKEKSIDLVAGPDSYKDLPRMLAITENNQSAVNVLLSLDETYADIMPVRLNENSKSAFVSIMRGCDNMCTYCIVPFTRGRERSRPVSSILEEVRQLSDQGVKEVTLLGQNVNSYRDLSETNVAVEETKIVKGFKTVYKTKKGGMRFADLLDKVSLIDPEMRIRFTSPHPKDFPDEVLHLINERPNICKSLHIPAQSGSSSVLERMRRGYTREAYLELVDNIRTIISDVALSSDFICGFCHETDQEFEDTITLMQQVKYDHCFLFMYSMREKTAAHRRYVDDIPESVKKERHHRMLEVYHTEVLKKHQSQINHIQLILVEGESKRFHGQLVGLNDQNKKTFFPDVEIPTSLNSMDKRKAAPGDYVAVKITNANPHVISEPLFHTSIREFVIYEGMKDDDIGKYKFN